MQKLTNAVPDAFQRKNLLRICHAAGFNTDHDIDGLRTATAMIFQHLHRNHSLPDDASGDEVVRCLRRLSTGDMKRLRFVALHDLYEPTSPLPLR